METAVGLLGFQQDDGKQQGYVMEQKAEGNVHKPRPPVTISPLL